MDVRPRFWRNAIEPRTMQRIHGWLTMYWVAMVPVSWAMGWLDNVTYVALLTSWGLVSGHWSGWVASRVDARQDADDDVADAIRHLRAIERHLGEHDTHDAPGDRHGDRRTGSAG